MIEHLVSTNPCGEQLLPRDGCCNLGAINLVDHWDPYKQSVDWGRLGVTVSGFIRLMNRIIDVSNPFDDRIDQVQSDARRIGMGTMGLADLLILKRFRYGSDESLDFIDELYRFIAKHAYLTSIEMAVQDGSAPALNGKLISFSRGHFIEKLNFDTAHIPSLIRGGKWYSKHDFD